MATMAPTTGYLTLGQAAAALHAQLWQVQRVIDRRLFPPPQRIGRLRVVGQDDLPALRVALQRAGFLGA
jgi:hypothetical protein